MSKLRRLLIRWGFVHSDGYMVSKARRDREQQEREVALLHARFGYRAQPRRLR